MQEFICVTGMILKQAPIGEYDRRICLLTRERGKISAFAKGARKPGSKLAAGSNPFSFGVFKLYEGKSSYTVAEADIHNYFEEFRTDFAGAYYGMYFAEVADYCTRENNDESQMLKLLYQSLRALCAPSLGNPLIKCIFEIKTVAVNGEFPGIPQDLHLSDSAAYAVEYIAASTIEKLYTFTVTDDVLTELEAAAACYRSRFMEHEFKSLEIIKTLC